MRRRTFCEWTLTGLLASGTGGSAVAARGWIDSTLERLDLDGRIAQLMMPMFEEPEEARVLVERFGVGGFVCFRGQAAAFAAGINDLQRRSRVPLLMSADFERGAGAYIDGATELPTAMALGATGDADLAAAAGRVTARESRALGVHVVFAPVLDVNNNPDNPIINVRSFGQSPTEVARLGSALTRGLEANGAMATLKHFPGHGNVAADTHRDLAALGGSRAELERIELAPFRSALFGARPQGVMAAHLWVKAWDPKPVPASLSPRVIGGLLRRQMGYTGLVYTDSLGMGAVINHANGDWAQVQVQSLLAGCDVLVMPTAVSSQGRSHLLGVEGGIRAIRRAVGEGRLSRARIDQSVRRVLAAKLWAGLPEHRLTTEADLALLASPEHRAVAGQIARRALTLVQDRARLLPLSKSSRIGIVSFTNREGDGAFGRASAAFVPTVQRDHPTETVQWSLPPRPEEIEATLALAGRVDVLLVAATLKVFVGEGSADLLPEHRVALTRIKAINPHIVFLSFGSPYALGSITDLPVLICAYDDSQLMQEAAAHALWTDAPWSGQLPVSIS